MMEKNFEKYTLAKRLQTMLKVDFRRMFTSKTIYIIVAACLIMPILILVMTTMMEGTVRVDPQTGKETVMEGFDNTWQIIGSVNSGKSTDKSQALEMDMISMCNINLLYFFLSVLVCLFVSEDFRSGYVKNLFTVRSKKWDYVISKTVVCTIGGVLMILAFFIGSILGGAISGLPFVMVGFNIGNLIMCVLSKVILVLVFVPIYFVLGVAAKQRAWLSILLSFVTGMFLFMVIPMLTPLNSTVMNPLICLMGGIIMGIGLGAVSKAILSKSSLV